MSATSLLVGAALFFAATSNLAFWRMSLAGHDPASPATWLYAAGFFIVLAAAQFAVLIPFSSRYLVRPFLTFVLVANAVAVYFIEQFHVFVNRSMLQNVLETDIKESGELITAGLLLTLLLYAAIPIAIVWTLRLKQEPLRAAIRSRLLATTAILLITTAAVGASYKSYSSFIRNNRESRHLITPANLFTAAFDLATHSTGRPRGPRIPIATDAKAGEVLTDGKRPVLFVLVVGETARASSFSLDGYQRETNPSLQQRNVINFPNVAACGTSTADALPCMFSAFGRSGFTVEKGLEYESLLDVLRRAGFSVHWIDNNSGCKHACDGVETEQVDRENFPPLCSDGECLDDILLVHLDDILRGPPQNHVVVLHQKGSHGPAYYRRYPREFERFTPACRSQDFDQCTTEEIRNAYDNSILYTDHVLGEVIDRLTDEKGYDSAMLYVSDHGESLGEAGFYLHGMPYVIAPDAQTHVPMVFWMSRQFGQRFHVDPGQLRQQAASHHYSHDNLFHSVLGLLDVHTGAYRHELDIFDRPHRRM